MKLKTTFLLLFITFYSFAGYAKNSDILGVWIDDKQESKVEFYQKSDGSFAGKIIWLAEPYDKNGKPLTDRKHDDKVRQTTPLIGLNIFDKVYFKNEEDKQYTVDYAYDPKRGMFGTGTININGKIMTVKAGKWGIRVTRELTRVK